MTAAFDPSRFVWIAAFAGVGLVLGVFYFFRARRRERDVAVDSPRFELATVSSLSTSEDALDVAFNGRKPNRQSEPQGQLEFREEGIGWTPGKMSLRRGSQSIIIARTKIDSASLYHKWNEAALFLVTEGEVTAFIFPRPALARLERQLLRSGLSIVTPWNADT